MRGHLLRRSRSLSAAGLAGLTLVSVPPASATTPSRLWWGVERIVVVCDADASADNLESDLCAAVTAHIRSRVSRPVITQAERKGGDPAADLLIKVSARRSEPGMIELIVRPKRIEIMNEAPPELISTVQGSASTQAALDTLVARSLQKILPSN
jgi:hypothetical protein